MLIELFTYRSCITIAYLNGLGEKSWTSKVYLGTHMPFMNIYPFHLGCDNFVMMPTNSFQQLLSWLLHKWLLMLNGNQKGCFD